MGKFLGISIAAPSVQYEGLNAVMDLVASTGAQAISLTPNLALPAEPEQGVREPPLDIDGYERLLDRPLWGKRELWMTSYRAAPYDEALFADTPYRPRQALAPADLDRDLPHQVLADAHARGMKVYLQIVPLSIGGLRSEDQIQYVDGSRPDPLRRVAIQPCLNSPAVRAYALATARDALHQFPEADGIFLDWVEYTVYDLRDHFACLCPHCARAAQTAGYDWARIVRDVRALWDRLHRLTARDLETIQYLAQNPWGMLELLQSYPGWLDFLRFKAETVVGLYAVFRQAMDDERAACLELGANGWAPPFNRSSGMDYRALSEVVQSLRPTLYTFHWSVLPRWYGQTLLDWNPSLPEGLLLDALVAILGLPDHNAPRNFSQYHIPAPHEDHPATPECWRAKLDEVVDQAGGRTPVYAYAHSYRSEAQWKRMIAVVRDSRVDGMWVTRYEYLSNNKFAALKAMWRDC